MPGEVFRIMITMRARHLSLWPLGCGGALLVAACVSTPVTPAIPAAASTNPLPASLTWVQRSAEYEATVRQTYRLAARHVDEQAQGRPPHSWAVVLDADETVISNLQYQIERNRAGAGYSTESWRAWVRRRAATPLPGAAGFLGGVRAEGGLIAIVTNRLESDCEDTAAVFRAHALQFDAMMCQPDSGPSDKNPRFRAIADGHTALGAVNIVAFLGDNILDFPSLGQSIRDGGDAGFADFGIRYFVLPNPMYGSWQ
jgi:5'-nucleotidase (lipoprotein e(P4) family)